MASSKTTIKLAHARRGIAVGETVGACAPTACELLLKGRVQGHGVRPALARLAVELGLRGWVANCHEGVTVHLEGSMSVIAAFRARAATVLPLGAELDTLHEQPAPSEGCREFRIGQAEQAGPLAALVPADRAICPVCRDEVRQPCDRRAGYALISCPRCGPRYSLLQSMPYEREATAMRAFQQCPRCASEFDDLSDRRAHSQINGCHSCGPSVWLALPPNGDVFRGAAAIERAVRLLQNDNIVALRGIGGYQLLLDATSEAAVRRLRVRKRRETKPFAVMVSTLAAADRYALLEESDRAALEDPANPVVIVRQRSDSPIAKSVAGGLDTLGLLLPTTALHASIAEAFGRPLVVTSGNLESDPLEYEPEAAERVLAGVADAWIHHDRDIVRPIDDSVVRHIAGRPTTIRLARGFAPLPLAVPTRQQLIAVGGHQKSAVALSNGVQAVLGPHLGDLDSEATRCRFVEHVKSLYQLYDFVPTAIAHDLHPGYFTTAWAESAGVPCFAIQHHHAHVVAAMIERNWLDRQVLGVAWDGTGYGADGTVWGGEFLIADVTDFRRVGSLLPFFMPAGESAIREPWRLAVSLAYQVGGPELAAGLSWTAVPQQRIEQAVKSLQRARHGVWTTSGGRLFDGVAALVLGLSQSGYEGEPALLLEAAANSLECDCYSLPLTPRAGLGLDWRPLIEQLLADRASGTAPGNMAMKFHRALAQGICASVDVFPELPVVLAGGCFQNRILTELVAERIGSSRPVALPGVIPVNDGGLAAGQLAVAAARLTGGKSSCV